MSDWAKGIWVYAMFIVGIFIAIFSFFQGLRLQDIGRSTKEAGTLHVQAENFALDALDMNLDVKYKHEGAAIILLEDIDNVKDYVENKVAEYENMKGDVENLKLTNVVVGGGTVQWISSGLGESVGSVPVQYEHQVPFYSATLTGEIVRIVRGVNDKRTIEFSEDIFVRADHIPRTD